LGYEILCYLLKIVKYAQYLIVVRDWVLKNIYFFNIYIWKNLRNLKKINLNKNYTSKNMNLLVLLLYIFFCHGKVCPITKINTVKKRQKQTNTVKLATFLMKKTATVTMLLCNLSHKKTATVTMLLCNLSHKKTATVTMLLIL